MNSKDRQIRTLTDRVTELESKLGLLRRTLAEQLLAQNGKLEPIPFTDPPEKGRSVLARYCTGWREIVFMGRKTTATHWYPTPPKPALGRNGADERWSGIDLSREGRSDG